ncbi:uncharacterized membrane protein YoaK (UPF0700 family) [Oxalobacteraceae bacterium GrIS 2.11]
MILRYFNRLSTEHRSQSADRHLGYSLAFVAGAVNAGGFLAIGQYTSHMTGIVSSMADRLALGNITLALSALSAWVAFVLGAATTAVLINFARRRHLRSQYALSLFLEALLLLLFGITGGYLNHLHEFLDPVTVLLLCFIMGLQNAIITKVSNAVIRTTHVTGLSTDLGIELGKLIYINRAHDPELAVHANREKLRLHALLIFYFFTGGVTGAIGFKHIGYSTTIFLAAALALLASGPIISDIRYQLKKLKTP